MEQVASIAVVKYRSNHEIQSSVLNCTRWAQTMAAMETIGQASLPFFFEKYQQEKFKLGSYLHPSCFVWICWKSQKWIETIQ